MKYTIQVVAILENLCLIRYKNLFLLYYFFTLYKFSTVKNQIMNQIKKFHIQLPLLIGKTDLLSHKLEQNLSSSQFKFKIDIPLGNFPKLASSSKQQYISCSCQLLQNQIHIFEQTKQQKLQNFDVFLNKNRAPAKFKFSYEVSIVQNLNDFLLYIKKQQLSFSLMKIQSVKFAKNQMLQKVLYDSSSEYQCGLLTKDQLDRFLVVNDKTNFASIGIWEKSSFPLVHPKTYQLLASYLQKQSSQKCIFSLKQKDYIYFVRISNSKKTPETYLVRWSEGIMSQNIVSIPKKNNQVHLSYPTFLQRSNQNGMQFTLKNPQTQTLNLQSQFHQSYLSPIKHIENNVIGDSFSNDINQLSPEFSTKAKKQIIQNQCFELRDKVWQQQNQIQRLNNLVKNLQTELKQYKQKNSRVSTQCWSKGSMGFSPVYSPKNNSPRIIRKLRESDLRSNSFSLRNSSQKKIIFQRLKFEQKLQKNEHLNQKMLNQNAIQSKQILTAIKQDQDQPWQVYELVE